MWLCITKKLDMASVPVYINCIKCTILNNTASTDDTINLL